MKEAIAKALLSIQAVYLRPNEPFIWASGIQSPIYCDNRLVLSYPDVRKQVARGLAELIRTHYGACELVAGTATAGIAHAALAADILELPMAYVRGAAKDHGLGNLIEGRVLPGQQVVVIEDLISTAGSVVETVNHLRDAGARVLGIVSIFTYGMKKGTDRLRQAQTGNVSLTDFDTLVRVAARDGYIGETDIARLMTFRDNPSDDGWMRA